MIRFDVETDIYRDVNFKPYYYIKGIAEEIKMNFNICKQTLDEDALEEKIRAFMTETGEDPYIFLSMDTAKSLNGDNWGLYENPEKMDYSTNWTHYKGCRTFLDPTKKFGEVELR